MVRARDYKDNLSKHIELCLFSVSIVKSPLPPQRQKLIRLHWLKNRILSSIFITHTRLHARSQRGMESLGKVRDEQIRHKIVAHLCHHNPLWAFTLKQIGCTIKPKQWRPLSGPQRPLTKLRSRPRFFWEFEQLGGVNLPQLQRTPRGCYVISRFRFVWSPNIYTWLL